MALCSEWRDSCEEEQGGGEGAASCLPSPSPPCCASSSFSASFSCSAGRLLPEGRGTGKAGEEGTAIFTQGATLDAGAGPNAGLGGEGRAASLAGGEEEEEVQEEEHGSWLSSVRYL